MEVVVSAACGVVVDPSLLEFGQPSPNIGNGRLGSDVSGARVILPYVRVCTRPQRVGVLAGLRLVCVDKGIVGHKWFTHDNVPDSVDPAADAQAWAASAAGDVVSKL